VSINEHLSVFTKHLKHAGRITGEQFLAANRRQPKNGIQFLADNWRQQKTANNSFPTTSGNQKPVNNSFPTTVGNKKPQTTPSRQPSAIKNLSTIRQLQQMNAFHPKIIACYQLFPTFVFLLIVIEHE